MNENWMNDIMNRMITLGKITTWCRTNLEISFDGNPHRHVFHFRRDFHFIEISHTVRIRGWGLVCNENVTLNYNKPSNWKMNICDKGFKYNKEERPEAHQPPNLMFAYDSEMDHDKFIKEVDLLILRLL